MSVGILVVSHSAKIAEGVVELARQMAPDVRFVAAGGTDDGSIGTSFEAITEGITALSDTDGVIVLCDLGSAYLTADTALDFLDDAERARVVVSHAPLVEGTVAGAVAAQTGGGIEDVVAAAATAAGGADIDPHERTGGAADVPQAPIDDDAVRPDSVPDAGAVTASVALVNESGLHARPAADFVRTAARFRATVRVNDVDAKSLLAIMALALPQGAVLSITATGADAQDAVDALVELVRSGFGED
ncbi:dihydroxyacetone kinase phosphoryl donor subunit DhaM [Curtobacterium sp. Leaf261]|uniref:dihydroxyacetone kinase phosphoryl donor subunit DhaM n=1 Tax=Curtobacterium sp. Leaf261 TaxID=1736311 RepID=UPI0006F47FC6|nr:dihydroxyacetone kinase phosphoryl donor subunit DhaM [Curtobacterium sp. Leaf261]KQO64836.1 PTS sugar transporter subunit IIA [Curtobacterium sp. Leaf261]